ncbi:MAG: EmrA/EmrK family multidrug efflux transporter periplasmic adaptor subunit, partial [Pseudomonadota bacterium]
MTEPTDNTAPEPLAPPGNSRRRKALMSIAAVVVLAGGAFVAYDVLVASRHEDTDNAYVQGNLVQITPQIGGTVIAILAEEMPEVLLWQ